MKIYRAVFEYNNADSCDWERWYTETSSWYLDKNLAEKHIPILQNFKDCLLDLHCNDYCFRCNNPYIEEQEVSDSFIPMDLKLDDKPFTGFNYIEYNGPMEITDRSLQVRYPVGLDDFRFYLYIGDEGFDVNLSGRVYKIEEKSNYYKYTQEIRDKLINICKDYYNSFIQPIYEKFKKSYNSLENDFNCWERQRVCGIKYAMEFLTKDYRLKLTENSKEGLKGERNSWRGKDYPLYRESLDKFIELVK
jgi:hypothetical protein